MKVLISSSLKVLDVRPIALYMFNGQSQSSGLTPDIVINGCGSIVVLKTYLKDLNIANQNALIARQVQNLCIKVAGAC